MEKKCNALRKLYAIQWAKRGSFELSFLRIIG